MNPCRILIVEDEALVAMEIEERLEVMGYQVTGRAASGVQALALLEETRPDLALMDIRLQGAMDGIAVAERIRKISKVPVIFLTAYSEDETLERAKVAEPSGYILKPFNDRELRSSIEIALYKHRAEEALRESEARYRKLFEQAEEGIILADAKTGQILECNRAFLEMSGYERLDLIGEPQTGLLADHGNNRTLLCTTAQCMGEGEGLFFSTELLTKSGAIKHVEVKANVLDIGKRRVVQEFLRDVTTELRYHEERETTLKLLRLLNAQKNTFELIRDLTDFLKKWTGCEAVGVRLRDGDDFPYFETHGFKPEFVQAENSLCALDETGRVVRDSGENPVLDCMCGSVLAGRFDPSLPFFTKKGSFWTNSTTQLLAETSEADRRSRTRNRCHGEGYESVALIALRYGANTLGLIQLNDRAKDRFAPELIDFLEKTADQIAMALSQQQIQAALKESEERLRMALYAAQMDVFEYSPATGLIRRTGSRTKDWHLPLEGTGKDYLSMVHPNDRKSLLEKIGNVTAAQPNYMAEYRLRGPDGTYRWIADWAEARFDPSGRMQSILGVGADITERKQSEEERSRVEAQLRQAQKMEALGTLAGGIAHDFNNILGVIFGYTEMASYELPKESRLYGDLEQVLKAAHRAKELVQQILTFCRRSEEGKKPVQVALIVKEAMKMLRASLPSTIEIKSNVASKAVVMADPTQIHQVLMNLCTNAAHAMRDKGGVLEVSLNDVRLSPEAILPHWNLLPGLYQELVVKDSGHGIDPAFLDRIFDPFFTTKEQGEGTGLGLSVVLGIVKSLGGVIEVESTRGEGSAFHVLLPSAGSPAVREIVVPAHLYRGEERILIVDDEPELVMLTKQMLENLGYKVDYRMNGFDALEVFRAQLSENPFDLVITDMTMPRLTGVELAVELRKMQPDLPVILCTGFSETIDEERAKSLGIKGFLMKPFVLNEIAELIRKVLSERN